MKIALVHNPQSGYRPILKEKLVSFFSEPGIEVSYFSTQNKSYRTALKTLKFEVVVVAGGDGTVRKVASQLLGSSIPIMVISLGTANNLSYALKHPLALREYRGKWQQVQVQSFDVGRIEFGNEKDFFLESAGYGAFPDMMHEYKQIRKRKRLTFNRPEEEMHCIRSFMRTMLSNYQPSNYEICIDDQLVSGKYLLVEVMNVRAIGPRLDLAPQASPDDGHFEVLLVQPNEKKLLCDYILALEKDHHVSCDLPVRQGKKISITTDCTRFHADDIIVSADELPLPDTMHMSIEVKRKALKFFEHSFTV